MAITLGTARQRCSDLAADASDTKADRVYMNWIRGALNRLWTAHTWTYFQGNQRLTMDVEVTGSDLTVTQDSASISRGSAWSSDYVTQAWDLLIADDQSMAFSISAVGSPTTNATLGTGQEWLQDSGSSKSYKLVRYRYSLPGTSLHRILLIEDLTSQRELTELPAAYFDRLRNAQPHRQGQPEVFTVRGNYLEFFPGPNASRRALSVTYVRKVTLPADADADAVELDWLEVDQEVFWKALQLEASVWLGSDARIKEDRAEREYNLALRSCVNRDAKIVERAESFGLGGIHSNGPGTPLWRYSFNTVPLADQD